MGPTWGVGFRSWCEDVKGDQIDMVYTSFALPYYMTCMGVIQASTPIIIFLRVIPAAEKSMVLKRKILKCLYHNLVDLF